MTNQPRHHQHGPGIPGPDDVGLAELLDLDAQVLGASTHELIDWVQQLAVKQPSRIVDVGAGTGAGALALGRRFDAAEVVAIDVSPVMLQRLRTAALEHGLADRLLTVQADLDNGWPAIGGFDIAWAGLSLHHLSDPDRVLADIHTALNPGGLVVIVELDFLPRFLPEDIGMGRPGLEERCHEAIAPADRNSHLNWRPGLERAGFAGVEQRSFTVAASPTPPGSGQYAHAYLRRIRSTLDGRMDASDLDILDRLLTEDNPDGLLHRRDLTVRSSRTAWVGRR